MARIKILYFTAGTRVTEKESKEIAELGNGVQVRNARFVESGDKPEACDGVAGSVPAIYEGKPSAKEALKTAEAALEKKARASGVKAPVKKAAQAAPAKKAEGGAWTAGQQQ